MMKDFFKKLSKPQEETDDLNLSYNDEFYSGAAKEPVEVKRPAEDRFEERPAEVREDRFTPAADNNDYYQSPRVWQEDDAPGYRERVFPEETPAETAEVEAAPEVAPEYLYFSPSTYRDCREGIVKGLSAGHVVVVRVGGVAAEDILRLFDYMMGAVLALEAEMVRPQAATVVLVPKGADFDENELEPVEDEYDEDDEYDEEYDEAYDEEYDEEYDEAYEDEYDDEYEEESDEDAR